MSRPIRKVWIATAGPLAFAAAAAPLAGAQQITFSVDWKGPTVNKPATGGALPITEADVLFPGLGTPGPAPLPNPSIRYSGLVLGLQQYPACLGHLPGTACGIEVDALSEGLDARFRPTAQLSARLWFSVDEFAVGVPGLGGFPQVSTESLVGDACADLFSDAGLAPGPLPPTPVLASNVGGIDGDGAPSATGFTYPGLGLVEPNVAAPGPLNAGDNLDGLNVDPSATFPSKGVYFSLEGALLDPLANVPGSNSAQANGPTFQPGDVLRTPAPGVTPVRYATATQLGLDFFGPGTDDLDGLILVENGDGIFQRSIADYDWLTTGAQTDMLMFSVRRGSAVIGRPDSIFGLPIEPGDVLVPPRPGGSPFPGIWIAAENLGLATVRSGTALEFGDDLDALDYTSAPMYDCNHNGIDDAVDIAVGSSMDANMNGIPDDCESDTMEYCFCINAVAPCDNGDPYPGADAGCHNSTGVGAKLTTGGTTSAGSDDLKLIITQLPLNKNGIVYMSPGGNTPVTFGDGIKCPTGPAYRYMGQNSGLGGTMTFGPGLAAFSAANFPLPGHILAGSTFHFQGWYRDPQGPCGTGKNMSNAVRVIFGP